MEHAQLHLRPEPGDGEKSIECGREAAVLEECPEIDVLLTFGVVPEHGPPRRLRCCIGRMAQLSLIESDPLIDQPIRRTALVGKMLAERADEMGLQGLSVGWAVYGVALSR